eukprot:11200353-Ditylum_brightwellii.AAC.1
MEEVITMVDLLHTPTYGEGISSSLDILSTAVENLSPLLPVDPERLQFDVVLTQDLLDEIVGGGSGGGSQSLLSSSLLPPSTGTFKTIGNCTWDDAKD